MRFTLWPYKRMSFTIPIPPDQAATQLVNRLSEATILHGEAGTVEFVGSVSPKRFRFHRRISYRNSFLPRVIGHLQPVEQGTHITLTITVHWWVVLFSSFMLFLALYPPKFPSPLLVPFAFLYPMTLIGFNLEYGKTMGFIEQLWNPPAE